MDNINDPFKDKRAHRKAMEKKRRDRLKLVFANLKKAIPALQNYKSPSRPAILKKATDHIIFMKNKNAAHWKDLEILKKENSQLETQISAMENDNYPHENGKFDEVKEKAKEDNEEFCELSDSSDSDNSYSTVNKSKKIKLETQSQSQM